MLIYMNICDLSKIKKKLSVNVSNIIDENIISILNDNNIESFENYHGTYLRNPSRNEPLYDKIVVPQGHPIPLYDSVVDIDNLSTNGPTLDGTKNTPNSMFVFTKNQCKPECCPSTYSCDGGCVCTTLEQRKYIGVNRGNNKTTKEYSEYFTTNPL